MKIYLVSIVLASCWLSISAQIEKFSYQPDKVTTGQVYFYKKSNQDGSNPHWVANYIANQTYMESLKWGTTGRGATFVTADINWSTFSVRKFVGGNISPSGERIIGGQLDLLDEAGNYQVKFGDTQDTMHIEAFPWHSYDFDFASLNLIWPHLKKPKSNFTINIADVVPVEGIPKFANKGPVEIQFEKEEKYNGFDCYKYNIDGQGLENRGCSIWVHKSGKYFIEYLIDLPDERSYVDMKFQLDRIEKMDLKEWEAFKLNIAKGE